MMGMIKSTLLRWRCRPLAVTRTTKPRQTKLFSICAHARCTPGSNLPPDPSLEGLADVGWLSDTFLCPLRSGPAHLLVR